MSDDAKFHRTFRVLPHQFYNDLQELQDELLQACDALQDMGSERNCLLGGGAQAFLDYPATGAISAWTLNRDGLRPVIMYPKKGQDFRRAATPWEMAESVLVTSNRDEPYSVEPVVDRYGEVICHLGWFNASEIFVPREVYQDFSWSQEALNKIIGAGFEAGMYVFGSHKVSLTDLNDIEMTERPGAPDSQKYIPLGASDFGEYSLITDIQGRLFLALGSHTTGAIEPSFLQAYDLILLPKLAFELGALATRGVIKGLSVEVLSKELTTEELLRIWGRGPKISEIAAFTGTTEQFRAYVLKKLISEKTTNPLRFLLNETGDGWNSVASRTHDVLMDRYDIWEAGHILSDKLGGDRLMIQTASENQIQNQSIERFSGRGVLDNPVVEVGGLPVAKSTVKTWELAGKLTPGTAERAPIVVK